ncbi:CvfD/Ygs/GSP13 family RNA-binding post-transcriptional regulator [Amedibacillus sp. YH-ame10]
MHYMVGEVVEGVITGIKPYGAFVYLDNKHNGLIHISEISERFVKDVHTYVKVNERVKVKIIDMDEDGVHLKLSLKAIEANKARSMRKRRLIQELPPMEKGFSTLDAHLEEWIQLAIR